MTSKKLTKLALTKRVLPLFLTPLFLIGSFPQAAYAEGLSLKINPSVLQIRAQSSSEARAPFIIQNQSDQSIKLKIGYKLFNPEESQNGKVEFLSEPGSKESIFEHIQVVDLENTPINTLDLGPKQQKQLQVRVSLPENQPSSDYYFSLIFLHDIPPQTDQNSTIRDKKDQHTITTIQGGIATNVLLAVGSRETAQGYIEEFSTPIYLQSGPVPFTINVKNSGLHYINPKGTIMIKNIFGQTVGKVEIPPTAVLAGTTRSLLDKDQLQNAIKDEKNSKALWQERFLLGFYSANINIAMAPEGPFYNQTVRFFAFPLHVLLGLILLIALVVSIYLRVKKKLA
jgi:hypothetical protein